MSVWAVKDAKETWQDVCDRAWAGEPQFVTRDGVQTVVVISLHSYEAVRLKKRRSVVRNEKLAFTISDADLFADDSVQWEVCDDKVSLA